MRTKNKVMIFVFMLTALTGSPTKVSQSEVKVEKKTIKLGEEEVLSATQMIISPESKKILLIKNYGKNLELIDEQQKIIAAISLENLGYKLLKVFWSKVGDQILMFLQPLNNSPFEHDHFLAIWNPPNGEMKILYKFGERYESKGVLGLNVALSPDGKEIAFYGKLHPDEGLKFWILNLSTLQTRLIGDFYSGGSIVWSNTGRYIAYNRIEGGRSPFRPYLWIYDVEKDTHWLLAEGGDLWKSFSPDDRWIVFNSKEGNIWLGKVDGSEFRTLARLLGSNYEWSPEGQRIAFYWAKADPIRDKETEAYLYVVNIDGTGLRRLAELPPGLTPARLGFRWKDDSTIVVYELKQR